MDGPTNQWTKQPLIELRLSTKNRSVLKILADCMPEMAIGNLLSLEPYRRTSNFRVCAAGKRNKEYYSGRLERHHFRLP